MESLKVQYIKKKMQEENLIKDPFAKVKAFSGEGDGVFPVQRQFFTCLEV